VDAAPRCFRSSVLSEPGREGERVGWTVLRTPEEAWTGAADLSDKLHIVYKDRPFTRGCRARQPCTTISGGSQVYLQTEPVVAPAAR